jgi:hypothetical protein
MPLEERKDRWNALMAVLRANSIDDWTARFLQALGSENEGKEIADSRIEDTRLPGAENESKEIAAPPIEDTRLPASVGLSRTLPLPASAGGIRGVHL